MGNQYKPSWGATGEVPWSPKLIMESHLKELQTRCLQSQNLTEYQLCLRCHYPFSCIPWAYWSLGDTPQCKSWMDQYSSQRVGERTATVKQDPTPLYPGASQSSGCGCYSEARCLSTTLRTRWSYTPDTRTNWNTIQGLWCKNGPMRSFDWCCLDQWGALNDVAWTNEELWLMVTNEILRSRCQFHVTCVERDVEVSTT